MADEIEPTLDSEGVPDLDGPLPEKEATGDPQEGESPPGDRPRASIDWGTTAEEEREGEPISIRVERELPETGATDPVDDIVADLALDRTLASEVDDPDGDELDTALDFVDEDDDDPDDDEDEELELDDELGQSAEEAAMHVDDGG